MHTESLRTQFSLLDGPVWLVRTIVVFLTAFVVVFAPAPASAHVFKSSYSLVYFNRDNNALGFLLDLNLEAILAQIDPELADTSDSPNAPEYDRLRALPPDELEKVFAEFKPTLLEGMYFELDGQRIYPEIKEITLNEVGDLSLYRKTTINFAAVLPPTAKEFSFHWSPAFGKITLRAEAPRARSMHFEVIEIGDTSSKINIDDVAARTRWQMIADFVKIGYEHILPKGLDHILFVVGIFLLSTRLKPILTQVTAFTIAHTATLGLSMLDLVNVPPSIVEPLIAASIVYVAVENILRPTLSVWRPFIVFGFGLLHGLGFAGILKEFGIPEGEFLTGLISFNVGVELGQLTVIALCFLAVGIWFGRKSWYRQRIVIPHSLAIAAIGGFWFFQRTLG